MAVRIEMLPAAHGDCLWIEWSSDDTIHRILIDGGPAHTYPRLLERIAGLPPDGRRFDLLVVTHIDADHIEGIVRLLRDAETLGVEFERVWFNGREQLDRLPERVGDGLGAVSGEYLQLLLHDLEGRAGDVWNVGFEHGIVYCDPEAGLMPKLSLPGGLTLTVVSPDLERLHDLDEHWEDELRRLGVDVGRPDELRAGLAGDGRLRPLADELGGDEMDGLVDSDDADAPDDGGRFPFDEIPTDLEVPLPDELGGDGGAMEFGSDDSPANGSSIALLAEWQDGPTVLVAGDAFAGVLQASVEHLLDGRPRLPLDVFKVPHHGSVANLTPDLLGLLACRAYMVSTNGAVFGHPHDRAVELLVEHHGHRARPRIVFNYRSETTAPFASELIGGRRCTVVYPEGSGITL